MASLRRGRVGADNARSESSGKLTCVRLVRSGAYHILRVPVEDDHSIRWKVITDPGQSLARGDWRSYPGRRHSRPHRPPRPSHRSERSIAASACGRYRKHSCMNTRAPIAHGAHSASPHSCRRRRSPPPSRPTQQSPEYAPHTTPSAAPHWRTTGRPGIDFSVQCPARNGNATPKHSVQIASHYRCGIDNCTAIMIRGNGACCFTTRRLCSLNRWKKYDD